MLCSIFWCEKNYAFVNRIISNYKYKGRNCSEKPLMWLRISRAARASQTSETSPFPLHYLKPLLLNNFASLMGQPLRSLMQKLSWMSHLSEVLCKYPLGQSPTLKSYSNILWGNSPLWSLMRIFGTLYLDYFVFWRSL